jgi:hypothetical protein
MGNEDGVEAGRECGIDFGAGLLPIIQLPEIRGLTGGNASVWERASAAVRRDDR